MTKRMERILFKTIEEAIEFGTTRDSYGSFSFQKLYDEIEKLEGKKVEKGKSK